MLSMAASKDGASTPVLVHALSIDTARGF
jgi:hypothetical protein